MTIELNGSYPISPEMADVMSELADERDVPEEDIHEQLATVRKHLAIAAKNATDIEQGGNDE